MRIASLLINRWRTVQPVEIVIPSLSKLVCLVGDNGSGKSSFLELVSAVAAGLGFAPGGVSPYRRGALDEAHHIEVTFDLTGSDWINSGDWLQNVGYDTKNWDGTLNATLEWQKSPIFRAGGMENELSGRLGNDIHSKIGQIPELKHVHIDADRAYPPIVVNNIRHILEALLRQQERIGFGYERAFNVASKPSSDIYQDWFTNLVEIETRISRKTLADLRTKRDTHLTFDSFRDADPLKSFRQSLSEMLPHLQYSGLDSSGEQLQFSVGSQEMPVSFHSLSGGERELAFLIGQVERFQLRKGLFLLDEPELHLNPSLVRRWLAYLRDTVTEGQVWIATHSLEAVEVAGVESTIVLEIEADSRGVQKTLVTRLHERPAMKVLANALGSPAFSISSQRFIAIEGESKQGEAARFYDLLGVDSAVEFVESGTFRSVVEWVNMMSEISSRSHEVLRLGGIVDRDFRTDDECKSLMEDSGLYVLAVHEIENVFLHPKGLDLAFTRHGLLSSDVGPTILQASDVNAGRWILDFANWRAKQGRRVTQPMQDAMRDALLHANWTNLNAAFASLESSLSQHGSTGTVVLDELRNGLAAYEKARKLPELWMNCDGKLIAQAVAERLNVTSRQALERIVLTQWQSGETPWPQDVSRMRNYITEI